MHDTEYQGSRNRRQRIPAPPPNVLGSSRDRSIANIFTACGFSHNDSQYFRNFTVESQEQWIALLESYQNKRFRDFTPGYEELPEILEKLRAVMSSHQSGSQQKERPKTQLPDDTDRKLTSTSLSTQNQPRGSDRPRNTKQPSAHVIPLPQTRQPLQHPDSMKQPPRLPPLSLRQRVREAGLEGVLCEFIPLASLADRDPCKELKERLEKSGMADSVEFIPLASLANENPVKRLKEHLKKFGMVDSVEWGLPGPF